jgi:hypothetical protein
MAALREAQVTRISVGRWRGAYRAGDDKADHAMKKLTVSSRAALITYLNRS